MAKDKGRRAKAHSPPASPRRPKAQAQAQTAQSTQSQRPLFSFLYADRVTTKAWVFRPSADDAAEIFEFLCLMGQLTWREIEAQRVGGLKKHHDQPVDTIVRDAQKDLARARLDKTFGGDEFFRFRLGGTKRLWGFRRGRIFYVVFWDPNHDVYDS